LIFTCAGATTAEKPANTAKPTKVRRFIALLASFRLAFENYKMVTIGLTGGESRPGLY
jgi:hypothetical protein